MTTEPMRFAYADPPYLGCCQLYGHYHPDGRCWDDLDTHRALIERLCDDYPDGWAMSLTSTSLRALLPLVPADHRVAAWTKPFAAFKRNVRIAYTWEPIIWRGGRLSSKHGAPVGRDHIAEPITMRKGFTGAKPEKVCRHVMDLLGWKPGDQLDDLYPGTGVFGRVLAAAENRPIETNGQPTFDFGSGDAA
ncbi:hypothetical protein ACXJJ3_11240 [Kribbella sp. WER1]